MEVKEFKAKTVDEAITAATLELGISSDKLQYEVVDAGENEELVRKYGVMQAPTLIVIKEEGVQKLANASNIRAFAEKR